MKRWVFSIVLFACVLVGAVASVDKPRVVVMTDISTLKVGVGEPDDTQSLIRFLLYSNEFDVEGLIATATGRGGEVHPDYIQTIIRAYGEVHANLVKHDPRYPKQEFLLSLVKAGLPGTECIGEGLDSEGSNWIISVVDKADQRPVWIVIWGGPRELAQALWRVEKERTKEELAAFKSKIRVFAISDQDRTASWIRARHPDLFYITSKLAFRGMYRGGDESLVSMEWVDTHVNRGHGSLGLAYPNYDGGDPWGRVRGVKEGDTPSFLYLIPNGLGNPEHPEWGSWGGRYIGKGKHYFDAKDIVESNSATVWDERATVFRWRPAYQADFQARLDWCVLPPEQANHPPVVSIDGPSELRVRSGERVDLKASTCSDPDGNHLSYRWFVYREAGTYDGTVEIHGAQSSQMWFTSPEVDSPKTLHIVLAVTDDGDPPLTRYGRVVVTVEPR
ncbi:MAG: DUF1593 domain-containing protein [Armatimonadota bacterium]|nr:DUF1593 domain-containing protein [Armatimonadota bacterium]